MPTMTNGLKRGDIIEVVQFDDKTKKHVRRVRVKRISTGRRFHEIIGENMKGKYPKEYALPLEPLERVEPQPNFIGWFHFDDSGEIDE